ncbi:MAG: type II toxin-antitoxin system VapC family toxin [Hyphomonadaceae bacterium]|nr:type II toxin-antitoxin system VapC family toxin [Hyphomonadaceae bacterium]
MIANLAKALFDTNILIDAIAGHPEARAIIETAVDPAISIITAFEVLSGTTSWDEAKAQALLNGFRQIDVDPDIITYAVALAKERRLLMPDAIIVATAQATGRTLITRDIKLTNEIDDPRSLCLT